VWLIQDITRGLCNCSVILACDHADATDSGWDNDKWGDPSPKAAASRPTATQGAKQPASHKTENDDWGKW
jgi:hypothetical protein